MEDIEIALESPETTEVEQVKEVVVLVREYKAGKNIIIEDGTIHCTYEYILPSSVVKDASYVHTDNNYTNEEKAKLARLENTDLSDYYNKAQTDSAITENLGNYYTKQETRTMILQDLESYYTKEDTDNKIATELEDYYKKAEIDTTLENYYGKTEVDNLIATGTASITAKGVAIEDTADYFGGENVEAALQEIGATLAGIATALATQSEVVA